MRIILISIGKTEPEYLRTGISIYADRLRHYIPFEIKEIDAVKKTAGMSTDFIKEKESALIMRHLTKTDCVVLLDESGQQHTSREFAGFMQSRLNSGIRELAFVIGGAWGFANELEKRANFKISLSKMTFSHQIVRLLFAEQLYRAFTILKGESYHND